MNDALYAQRPDLQDQPDLFAREMLGLEPTTQQRNFLAAIARPGARVAARSGHGTGKSTALAIAALWFLFTRKDALVPCTAPTAHQLQDVLWREIRHLLNRMDPDTRSAVQTTSDRITLKGSAGMIVARTSRPENPDALQGFHAPEILFVIDEAAGVSDAVFEVARGTLSTPSARVALAGNPTRLNGYFHSAFKSARTNWNRLHFSCLESPLVAPEYARDIADEYGEDSDMYRVRVLGEFPKSGLYGLIPLEQVDAAMARNPTLLANIHAPLIMGVDPAWLGSDRSAAVSRQGMCASILFSSKKLDTVQLTETIARHAAELNPDAIFVDQTGVGAGVLDQLRLTRHPVTGVAFGGTPLEPEKFLNRRAEMWWRIRQWLEQGPALEPNADLRDDLMSPEFRVTTSGKIRLETKEEMAKRGLASPDLGDALALTFAMPVYKRDAPARTAAPEERKYNVYDWMERE